MDELNRADRLHSLFGNLGHQGKLLKAAAELTVAFRSAGVDVVVIKGPATNHYLFDKETRWYSDIDLLVAPSAFEAAGAVLREHGFVLAHETGRRLQDWALAALSGMEREWRRGDVALDLHRGFHFFTPGRAWAVLGRSVADLNVFGTIVKVPDPPGAALLTTMHAASVAYDSPGLDRHQGELVRALTIFEESTWEEACSRAGREWCGGSYEGHAARVRRCHRSGYRGAFFSRRAPESAAAPVAAQRLSVRVSRSHHAALSGPRPDRPVDRPAHPRSPAASEPWTAGSHGRRGHPVVVRSVGDPASSACAQTRHRRTAHGSPARLGQDPTWPTRNDIAGVDDDCRVCREQLPVDVAVVGDHDDGVEPAQVVSGQLTALQARQFESPGQAQFGSGSFRR